MHKLFVKLTWWKFPFHAEVCCSVKYRYMILMPTDPKFIKGYYLKYRNVIELTPENLIHT